ncbi:MAG: DUF86 domain-containing protein [Pirellulales bacterium]
MTVQRTCTDFLQDIIDAAQKARGFVENLTRDQFATDDKTQFAVVRALEIIGEAAKRIPMDIRTQHVNVPWRSMAGIRDKLIHDYVSVNLDIVWKTVQEDLPSLIPLIEQVLDECGRNSSEKTD